MTTTQNMRNATSGADSQGAIHLLLTQGKVEVRVDNPEQIMEEIRVRAEQVSSILEGILTEPHGEPRWGLNE